MKKRPQKSAGRVSTMEKTEKPIDLLKEDHDKVKKIFRDFEKAEDPSEKEQLVRQAIHELKIHAEIEEGLFYPAVREEIAEKSEENEELLDEALEEHHVLKLLISELENMKADDERFDAKFTVLAENVKHHIEEEEGEMFPKAKRTEANSEEMATQMMERKENLKSELGVSEESEEGEETNNSKKYSR